MLGKGGTMSGSCAVPHSPKHSTILVADAEKVYRKRTLDKRRVTYGNLPQGHLHAKIRDPRHDVAGSAQFANTIIIIIHNIVSNHSGCWATQSVTDWWMTRRMSKTSKAMRWCMQQI